MCAILTVAIVALGGFTRLSDSGLSMVEWHPFGLSPPMDETQWREEFTKYQAYPQFQLENPQMVLAQFKRIYLIEYSHRMLARGLAAVFLLPFLWFTVRGGFRFAQWLFLLAVGGLIGGQGLLGWWMVESGLRELPMVDSYLLAAHLTVAMVIYAGLLWAAWNFRRSEKLFGDRVGNFIRKSATLLPYLILLTIFSGGLNAANGAAYHTFPLMNGELIPPNMLSQTPLWLNLGENPTTIHFTHRLLALLLLPLSLLVGGRLMVSNNVHLSSGGNLLLLAIVLQVGLGAAVVTQSGWFWAWLHQLGAVLLFTAALRAATVIKR